MSDQDLMDMLAKESARIVVHNAKAELNTLRVQQGLSFLDLPPVLMTFAYISDDKMELHYSTAAYLLFEKKPTEWADFSKRIFSKLPTEEGLVLCVNQNHANSKLPNEKLIYVVFTRSNKKGFCFCQDFNTNEVSDCDAKSIGIGLEKLLTP